MMSKPEFVYVTYIKTTPEKLWRALTTTEFTKQYWFGTQVESDWKEGSTITLFNDDGKTVNITGSVLRCNPPHELSYSWSSPQSLQQTSRVTFNVEPGSDHVKLTVTHDQFTPGSDTAEKVSKGWPAVLSSLKSLLESGNTIDFSNWKKCG
jgi:uncharacterized protein YndB with AHSA1/START domain